MLDETSALPILAEIEARLKSTWRMNDEQIAGVQQEFLSETGLVLICGHSGTSKTMTSAAAAHEQCLNGNKVLCTCPSNKTTDAALPSFLKDCKPWKSKKGGLAQPEQRKIPAVSFLGGYKIYEERKKLAELGVDVKSGDDLISPTITAAAKANPDTLYHIQKDKAIRRWASIADHAMQDNAEEYRNLGKKPDSREVRKKLVMLDEGLSEYFIVNDVDIVFTTCLSACHMEIQKNFKPKAAFVDEAGLANMSDICMVHYAYKEYILRLTMSGDTTQLISL